MISLHGITKVYMTRQGPRVVLDDINLSVARGQKIGILGRNGSGKSTLIRLIGGAEQATRGAVVRGMSVSWPLAFTGGFQGSLTGVDNLRFICRVYGANIPRVRDFVEDFAELGIYFNEPVKKYSAGMRARLAFALSMAIEFDCYLIDETLSVGDSRFQDKCQHELFEKRADRAMLMVSHIPNQIRDHCNLIYVLHDARITRFDDVDQAYDYFNRCA